MEQSPFAGDISPPKSTYLQYKEYTSVLLKWLVETAATCGFKNPSQQAAPPKSTRLKGNARKEAKLAAARGDPSGVKDQEHLVPISDLLPCAQAIARRTKPRIAMPKDVVQAASRAIKLRRDFATWYQSCIPSEKQSNEGHNYFIGQLETTLSALSVCIDRIPKMTKSSGNSATSGSAETTCRNIFACLELEESMEDDTREAAPALPQKTSTTYTIDAGEDATRLGAAEKMFAAHCLFQDLKVIRAHSKSTWLQYTANKIDLIAASITTTIASAHGRKMISNFTDLYTECDCYLTTLEVLLPEMGSIPTKCGFSDFKNAFMSSAASPETKDILFSDVFSTICGYREFRDGFSRGLWFAVDRSAPEVRSFGGNISVFRNLGPVLSEYDFTLSHTGARPMYDEATHLTANLAATCFWEPVGGIGLDAVFSMSLLLDIAGFLTIDTERGFRDLVQICTSMGKSMDACEQHHDEGGWYARDGAVHGGLMNKTVERFAHLRYKMDLLVFKDSVLHIKKMCSQLPGWEYSWNGWREYLETGNCSTDLPTIPDKTQLATIEAQERAAITKRQRDEHVRLFDWFGFDPTHFEESFYLLRHDPILCGLIATRLLEEYESFGLAEINRSLAGLATAHLHHALVQQDPPAPPWIDLERLVRRTEKGLSGAEGAKTPEQYCNHYAIYFGFSLINMVPGISKMRRKHQDGGKRRDGILRPRIKFMRTAELVRSPGSNKTIASGSQLQFILLGALHHLGLISTKGVAAAMSAVTAEAIRCVPFLLMDVFSLHRRVDRTLWDIHKWSQETVKPPQSLALSVGPKCNLSYDPIEVVGNVFMFYRREASQHELVKRHKKKGKVICEEGDLPPPIMDELVKFITPMIEQHGDVEALKSEGFTRETGHTTSIYHLTCESLASRSA